MTVSKSKIYSSIKWNTLAVFLNIALVFIQMYILFRLLSKEDFGIMASISAVYFYLRAICTFQIGEAILYIPNIGVDKEKLSSVFWALIILSSICYALVLIIGPFYGHLFKEDAVYFGLKCICVLLFFDVFYEINRALIHKELLFKELFKISFLGKVIYFVSSILLAYLGLGYKALLFSFMLSSISETIFAMFFGRRFFKPLFCFKWSKIKDLFSFGGYSSLVRFLREIRNQFDTILVGKFLGLEILGVYNIFKSLFFRIVKILAPLIGNVMTPLLAKEKFNQVLSKKIFYRQTKVYVQIAFPLFIGFLVFSKTIVGFYFGNEYLNYLVLFKLLSIAFCLSNITALINTLVIAYGKFKSSFHWNGLSLFFYLISVSLMFSKGVEAFALGLIIFFVVKTVTVFYFIIKNSIGGEIKEFVRSFMMELIFSILLGLIFTIILNFSKTSVFMELLLLVIYTFLAVVFFITINRKIIKELFRNTLSFKSW